METELKFKDDLVALVKEKKELSTLDDDFIFSILKSFLTPQLIDKIAFYDTFKQCKRAKEVKQLVADVRRHLREVYGLFVKQPLPVTYKKLMNRKSNNDEIALLLLQSHQSSYERFAYYASVYEQLFEQLESLGLQNQFVLADFACGCNPFAYSFLPHKPRHYVACDLSSQDMVVVNDYFNQASIPGEAFAFDLLSSEFQQWLSKKFFDVVFLFKALDSLEAVKRHASKSFLDSLPTKFLVVSFALRSIGGRQSIAGSRRVWFERFCQKQGWFYLTVQIPNELFYVVKCK